ncbi:MAG: NAD(P)H-binding protein, partial [Candidatus Omnitrophota bacterium]
MEDGNWDIVTGANGFTGKYITKRLLASGGKVKSLTGHPGRKSSFGDAVPLISFHFDDEAAFAKSLEGVKTVYNTYWIRYPHGNMTYDRAIKNTISLIRAAKKAGVERFVHISIANPDENSPLPYYRGKGILEKELMNSGLSYAILRPAVLFGDEGVLIN